MIYRLILLFSWLPLSDAARPLPSIVYCSFCSRDSHYNAPDAEPVGKLFIDPAQLTKNEDAAITKALLILTRKRSFYDTVRVATNTSVTKIVKENYLRTERDQNFKWISKEIKVINRLNDKFLIFADKFISIPSLPSKPSESSSKKYTQVFDLIAQVQYVTKISSIINNNFTRLANISKKDAGFWTFRMTTADYRFMLANVPNSMVDHLKVSAISYVPDAATLTDVRFSSDTDPGLTSGHVSTNDRDLIDSFSSLSARDFGTYYVLDIFDKMHCLHGDKVLGVIYQRLKEYGIDTAKASVKPVPVNYFSNEGFATDFLKSYYNYTDGDVSTTVWQLQGRALLKSLEQLNDNSKQECKRKDTCLACAKCIPEGYLNACFKGLYSKNPDIISSSFYTSTVDNDILPNFNSSPTSVITAALDDAGRKIEDIIQKTAPPAGMPTIPAIQPLTGYYLNAEKVGSIIVGCVKSSGQVYGMYSSEGNGVTACAFGSGWGYPGNCLIPSDLGTSFSTPDVGVNLYVAKAYWRAHDFVPPAAEARIRLLLSSDINPLLVGKFGSGGTLNLRKLIRLDDAFVVKADGQIYPCKILDNSKIQFDDSYMLPFGRKQNQHDGIPGLVIIEDSVFLFQESLQSWKKVNVDTIQLNFELAGKKFSIQSIAQLKSICNEIFILKH